MKKQAYSKNTASNKTVEKVNNKSQVQTKSEPDIRFKLNETVFEKLSAANLFTFYIVLVFIIGIVSLYDYFLVNKLFFFSDIGSDTINSYFPSIMQGGFLAEEQFIPMWSFYTGMGQNIYQGLPFEPFALLYVPLMYIFGSDYMVYGGFYHHFLFFILPSGILFYLFLSRLQMHPVIKIIGALLITYLGYSVLGSSWGYDRDIFLGTALLFAFEELYTKKRWYFLPLAFLYVSVNPFHLYFFSLFLFTYVLFRYFSSGQTNVLNLIGLYVKIFVLGLLGIVANGATVIGTYMQVFNSPRVTGEAGLSEVLANASDTFLPQLHNTTALLRLFSNDILGNGDKFTGWYNYLEAPALYCGLITLLLLPQLFLFVNNRLKITYGLFLLFWILPVFIPQFRYALYLYMGDYYKNGLNFFITATLLIISLNGLNILFRQNKLNIYVLAGTLLFLLIILYYPYNTNFQHKINTNIRLLITFLLITYTAIVLVIHKTVYKAQATYAFILLVVIELILNTKQSYLNREAYNKTDFKVTLGGYNDGTPQAVTFIKNSDKSFFRIEKDYTSGTAIHSSLNDAQVQGYFGTANYSSFNNDAYTRFLKMVQVIPQNEIAQLYLIKDLPLNQFVNTALQKNYINSYQAKQLTENKISITKIVLDNAFKLNLINQQQYIGNLNSNLSNETYAQIIRAESQTIETASRWAQGLKGRPLLQSMASVKYHFSKQVNPAFKQFGFDSIATINDVKILKNRYYLPFGCLYDSVIVKSEYKKLSDFQKDAMLLRALVIDSGFTSDSYSTLTASDSLKNFDFTVYESFVSNLKKDTFAIQSFTNNNFTGTVNAAKSGLLFFSIPFDRGWTATLNNTNVPIIQVNEGLMAIALNAGQHTLELHYFAPHFYNGLYATAAGWAIYIILLIFTVYKNKSKSTKSNLI